MALFHGIGCAGDVGWSHHVRIVGCIARRLAPREWDEQRVFYLRSGRGVRAVIPGSVRNALRVAASLDVASPKRAPLCVGGDIHRLCVCGVGARTLLDRDARGHLCVHIFRRTVARESVVGGGWVHGRVGVDVPTNVLHGE